MDVVLFIWLASIVDKLSTALSVFTVISIILLIFVGMVAWVAIGHGDFRLSTVVEYKGTYVKCWCAVFAVSLFNTILPTEKTMYLMGAAYIAKEVVASDASSKVLDIINLKLDSYVHELKAAKLNKLPEPAKP